MLALPLPLALPLATAAESHRPLRALSLLMMAAAAAGALPVATATGVRLPDGELGDGARDDRLAFRTRQRRSNQRSPHGRLVGAGRGRIERRRWNRWSGVESSSDGNGSLREHRRENGTVTCRRRVMSVVR